MANHKSKRWKAILIWIVAGLISIILFCFCYIGWISLGTMFSASAIALMIAFILTIRAERLDARRQFIRFALPGYALIRGELEDSKDGDNLSNASRVAYITLLLCVLGTGCVSGYPILEHLGILYDGWNSVPESSNWEHAQLLVLQWEAFILVSVFFYCLFSLIMNLLVQLSDWLSHQTNTARNTAALVKYFQVEVDDSSSAAEQHNQSHWDLLAKCIKDVSGHKIWAGERTAVLLDSIRKRDGIGTSHLFLLESAAQILERQIDKDSNSLVLEYDTLDEYSAFLRETMCFSTKSMTWFVDPKDLEKYLFPRVRNLALIATALLEAEDSNSENCRIGIQAIVDYRGSTNPKPPETFCKHVCRHKCKKEGTETCNTEKLSDADRFEKIVGHAVEWAKDTLREKGQLDAHSETQLINIFNTLQLLSLSLAHFKGYLQHHRPKARIFLLDEKELTTNEGGNDYTSPHLGLKQANTVG